MREGKPDDQPVDDGGHRRMKAMRGKEQVEIKSNL